VAPDDPIPPKVRPAVTILLVEDNEDDIVITKRALEKGHVLNPLVIARDGDEALDCVYRRGAYAGKPRPGLILLDLNLPRVDGFTVLETIKKDPEVCTIPIIILTTSKRDEDVLRSYRSHANTYLEKPVEFERFVTVIQNVHLYWNLTAKLAPAEDEPLAREETRPAAA
jgi:CheY-like chemotaxis protein